MLDINSNFTVKQRTRDMLLNLLTVSSGAIDAISFLVLGKVFSAFMTGNIAFLGLRTAGDTAPAIVAIFSSLLGFALGVYVSARITGPTKDVAIWSERVTYALGISLIAHAFFQIVWFAVDGQPSPDAICILLALWAYAMGMQSAAIRSLHVDGVFTTAATATIIFLVGDLARWSSTAVERRRLVGVLISLILGSTAGGSLLIHAQRYAPVLPFVLTIIAVVTASVVMRRITTVEPVETTDQ